jgi:hypothetical protein
LGNFGRSRPGREEQARPTPRAPDLCFGYDEAHRLEAPQVRTNRVGVKLKGFGHLRHVERAVPLRDQGEQPKASRVRKGAVGRCSLVSIHLQLCPQTSVLGDFMHCGLRFFRDRPPYDPLLFSLLSFLSHYDALLTVWLEKR